MENFVDELKNFAFKKPELANLDLTLIIDKLIELTPDQQKFLQERSRLHNCLLNTYIMLYNNRTDSRTKDVSKDLINEVEIVNETVEFDAFIKEFDSEDNYQSTMSSIVDYNVTEYKIEKFKNRIEELQEKISETKTKISGASQELDKVVEKDGSDEYIDLINYYKSPEKEEVLREISEKVMKNVKSSYITELTENLNRIINYLSHGDFEFATRPIDNHYDAFKISKGLELFCIFLQDKISRKSQKKLENLIKDYLEYISI